MTRRILHVWFPHWRTDLWRRQQEGGKPTAPSGLALYIHDTNRNVVLAVDPLAQQRGVTCGMTIAQARYLAPGLIIAPATPAHDATALRHLAQWFTWVAPWCAPACPDGIWVDLSGSAHLHGGEAALLQKILARLDSRDYTGPHLAISDTAGASYALSHSGSEQTCIVPPKGQLAALDPLPITALRLAPATLATLDQLGITTIAALRKMPIAPLVRRFGAEFADTLNDALGLRETPLQPLQAESPLVVRRNLREPIITAEAIGIGMQALLKETCLLLQKKGLGVRRLSLTCARVDNAAQSVSIVTAEPINDPTYLFGLLKNRIAHIAPGFGIEAMQIHVDDAAPILHTQLGLLAPMSDTGTPHHKRFLDGLHNKPGVRAVFQLVPAPSAVPERSQTRQSAFKPRATTNQGFPVFAPRPVQLLRPAEPIHVMTLTPDAHPRSFCWRGRTHRIRQAEGPERLHGEWWHSNAEYGATRDYWHVEDDRGQGFWLYCRGDGAHSWAGDQSWFLHGLF